VPIVPNAIASLGTVEYGLPELSWLKVQYSGNE